MPETPYSNLLRSITQKTRWQSEELMKNLEVTPQQARAIAFIAANQDKGLIQKDLVEAFQRRGASITSQLQGLEKKGYIERRIQPDNERQKNLYILPKGQEIVAAIDAAFLEMENSLTRGLTPEEKVEFKRLLTKIDNSL